MSRINVDLDYTNHPKTKRLVAILGDRADIYPIRMWCYLGKFHERDGRFKGYTAAEIEGVLDWRGDPGVLVEALVKVEYLEKIGDEYRAHDWEEHEGHLYAWRVRGRNNARKRWGNANSIAVGNAPSVPSLPTKPSTLESVLRGTGELQVKNRPLAPHQDVSSGPELGVGVAGKAPDVEAYPKTEPSPNKAPSARFEKPTLEQVRVYIAEKGYPVDAEKWWHHYESNGWMVGRVPMKKWKAAVFTWSKGDNHVGNSTAGRRVIEGDHAAYKPGSIPGGVKVTKCGENRP
jgi:hypothetical protein